MEELLCRHVELPQNLDNIEQHVSALPRVMQLAKDPKPLTMTYYDQPIHLFRSNRHLKPSDSYTRWATAQLLEDPRFKLLHLTENDAANLVFQEWRTHMARSIYEARLNPHNIQDGPVVTRSRNGVIRVQLGLDERQVVDAIETIPKRATKSKSPKKKKH